MSRPRTQHAPTVHQCVPVLIPGSGIISGLSLLVLVSAPRGFSPGTPVFPSPQEPIFDLRYHGRWILTKNGKNCFSLFKLRNGKMEKSFVTCNVNCGAILVERKRRASELFLIRWFPLL